MSLSDEPTTAARPSEESDGFGPISPDGIVASVFSAFREHFATWSKRYVEMRVDARGGSRENR
jgi:hypothetical protein